MLASNLLFFLSTFIADDFVLLLGVGTFFFFSFRVCVCVFSIPAAGALFFLVRPSPSFNCVLPFQCPSSPVPDLPSDTFYILSVRVLPRLRPSGVFLSPRLSYLCVFFFFSFLTQFSFFFGFFFLSFLESFFSAFVLLMQGLDSFPP